ncbi:MAG: hypothetical protein KIS86_14575, partial [Devosia sp.]|nr:hypothetical protein [Devosia sp.]
SGDAERDRTSALIPTTQSAGNAIGAALAGLAANAAGYAVATSDSDVLAAIIPLFLTGTIAALGASACAFAMVGRIQAPLATEEIVPSS